ncbi:CRAL-TRIO domain-containing protein [Syncephalastrum racemosum]|uniref:CRAL-TRIO domain-containing protein n=1 Tax=Syncephalastrum racemosum TaxID=13706 RepID=A0A1X2HSS3_SYNRA|nr:CRAL-TRIO domain-containing protein [Syncephalastrum racemosum]
MLPLLQEKAILLDSQYKEHKNIIIDLSNKLQQALPTLDLSPLELQDARTFLQDHVNVFRFLRNFEFDEQKAYDGLLDTVIWRRDNGVGAMTWESVAHEFFDGGFAFFHSQDKLGRPMAVVRMRYFPQFSDKSRSLTEYIQPYACLVMEIARKIMRDITHDREKKGVEPALVSQMVVIIDIGKAPFIPVEAQLIQTLVSMMDNRFPGFMGSIYVMNFGWMYQGLWQMVKYLLSDQARSRISFPSAKEILEIVDPDCLLEELGGKDPYSWTFDTDQAIQRYGTRALEHQVEVPLPSPVASPHMGARSMRSDSVSSDEFFDAVDTFSLYSSYATPGSTYATPGTRTPVLSTFPSNALLPIHSSPQASFCYWTGLHMGAAFLTSFVRAPQSHPIDTVDLSDRLMLLQQQQQQLQDEIDDVHLLQEDTLDAMQHELVAVERHTPHFPHLLPPDDPQSAYAMAPVRVQLQKMEQRIVRLTRRLFRLTFAYKGAVYWVLLYIFLRGPVENVLRRSLVTLIPTQQKVAYTTIGLTAAVAGLIGTSITPAITEPPRRRGR